MRRSIGVAAAGAIAAAAIGFLGGGIASASQSGDAARVIKLISRATAINNFVDTGPSGSTPGDLYIFSDRLFSASAPDTQIGMSDGRCVLIDPATLRFDCSITATLPDGDIMFAGTLTLVEGTTSTGAIVGGTGAYEKARGEGTTILGPLEGPHAVTIELLLNP
jgi:hypothetical protein